MVVVGGGEGAGVVDGERRTLELARGMEIVFIRDGEVGSYDGSGKSERKGVCGKLSVGGSGYHRGVAGRSLLGVWGEEGRFWWKIEPEYGRQDQQKVI